MPMLTMAFFAASWCFFSVSFCFEVR